MRSEWWPLFVSLAGTVLVLEGVRVVAHRRQQIHRWDVAGALVRRCARPAWLVVAVAVLEITLPSRVARSAWGPVAHGLAIALICGLTWFAIQVIYALTDILLLRLTTALGTRDNRRARRARTQLLLVRRMAAMVAIVIGAGAVLLTFTRVRALGASLLASAGIAGAVAGVAARPTLGNLVAGLQIAFSDMLRMDDVVVVEDEWGRIDDITLTYVVVRTWDERRLIIPTSYFVDNLFQNWTRHESRVIGTVYVTVDFSVPVSEIRAQVQRILEASPLWDRRDWVVQVTEITPQGVELRMLMSAADAASAWDLRCEVREQLLRFLHERYPEALPRTRIEAVTAPLRVPPEWADGDRGEATDRPRQENKPGPPG